MNRASLWLSIPPALAMALGLSLVAPSRAAEAKPEYAKKEGKECAYCHVKPGGGGPRNEKGNEYAANNHKFLATGYGEDNKFTTEANGKAFGLVRKAIEITHWSEAIKKLTELKAKEKKGAGAQLVMNTMSQMDSRGQDLMKAAKEAIQGGKVAEAADALARVEKEFAGRDPAKDLAKVKGDLEKIAGAKEAEVAAQKNEVFRLMWLDAQMREAEAKTGDAMKLLQDLIAKNPDGPFTADAKTKLDQLSHPTGGATPAMGG